HLLEAVVTVRGLGMGVQIATQVGKFHQNRQAVRARRVDLAPVLAQLRRDIRQLHRGKYLFFGFTADPLIAAEDAVLVDLEAAPLPQAPDGDVVRLVAREVVQRRTEARLRYRAQIHL